MDLRWTDGDRAFEREVRAFLEAHLTDELRAGARGMTSVYCDPAISFAWQRILHKKGWVAPAWPEQYGGCGWNITQRYIWERECAAAGAPPLSPMGLKMCGPALIGHGTAEQKAYFLPRMLSGEHFWCQGYSEPEAGSDLAALAMPAEDHGDFLICKGMKTWVTHGNQANWIFCLVRTSQEDRPQRGISFLLIDMNDPGITVRPIVSPAGENIQNEVHFDAVRVPKSQVVGPIGEGWTVAKYLLEFERGGSAYAPELLERVRQLFMQAREPALGSATAPANDPVFSHRLASVRARIMALEMLELQAMSRSAAGVSPGTTASIMKILGTELAQEITELALECAGPLATLYQPQAGRPGGPVVFPHATGTTGSMGEALAPLRYFNQRAGSIYAGSNEVQRNILAKAALRL